MRDGGVPEDEPDRRTVPGDDEPVPGGARRNFALNTANGAVTKAAEQLASPGVVLPLLLAGVGAPVSISGALEPVRRGAALLPGLLVSGRMRAYPVRKGFWVAAGLVQAATMAVMAYAAARLAGVAAGVVVLVMLAVFSLASGAGSVAFGDVMAKTIPKARRGRLLGARAALGGVAAIGVGAALQVVLKGDVGRGVFVWLLCASAALWALGSWFFARMDEPAGPAERGRTPLAEARAGMEVLRDVPGFRRFLVARGLLSVTEVALPFYVLAAREAGVPASTLGGFLVASGVAAVVSNPIWGRVTDRASDQSVMTVAGLVGTAPAAGALGLLMAGAGGAVAFSAVVLVAVVAQEGVRLGRKAYLVNAAPPDERPLYVAVSNTLMGVVMIALAGLGFVADAAGLTSALAAILALSVLGIVATLATPEPERMVDER